MGIAQQNIQDLDSLLLNAPLPVGGKGRGSHDRSSLPARPMTAAPAKRRDAPAPCFGTASMAARKVAPTYECPEDTVAKYCCSTRSPAFSSTLLQAGSRWVMCSRLSSARYFSLTEWIASIAEWSHTFDRRKLT